jgi:hypothetical protein
MDDLPGMSTPTNHIPAEWAAITKILDLIEQDIPDYPSETMPLNGNPKREIPVGTLELEERYTQDTPKEESDSGSGVNAIERSADAKKRKEEPASVILPPTPSISPSIEETEAQVNEHAGHVKEKKKRRRRRRRKKSSFLTLPPPETLKPAVFDYIAPPIGGGDGGGGS